MKTYALYVLMDAYGQVVVVAYSVLSGHGLVSIFIGVAALRTLLLV